MRNMFSAKSALMAGAKAAFAGAAQTAVESLDGLRRALRVGRPGEGKARRAAYAAKRDVRLDSAGAWHGRSGDKLARKAASGTVGINGRRSPLQSWASHRAALRASLPRSKRDA